MNILKRLFKIGESEAHSAIDKMEDPIKLTEQGIRDMKGELDKSLESLAQVKAMEIRSKNEIQKYESAAKEYQNKAILLLQKAKKGGISMEDAERLAKESLLRKEENEGLANVAKENYNKLSTSVNDLDKNVKNIKSNIAKWENEAKTLKARAKVSSATKQLNKQLAQVDTSSTVSMLERMKEKLEEEEALAEAYGSMANESKSLDDEIDKLVDSKETDADDSLAQLKAQLGLNDDKI